MYFLLNLSHYVKSCGHFCQNFGIFYDSRSPNMVISRDQRSNFANFLFVLIPLLILGKSQNFLVKKLSTSEVISQKPHGWWKPPLSAFRVNAALEHLRSSVYKGWRLLEARVYFVFPSSNAAFERGNTVIVKTHKQQQNFH